MIYLLDTDFLIALTQESEANHQLALKRNQHILSAGRCHVSTLVLQELATVLSYRWSQVIAKETTQAVFKTPQLILEPPSQVYDQAWQLFFQQTKKRTSFVDCSNVVFAQHLGAKVVSFDHFYTQFSDVYLVE